MSRAFTKERDDAPQPDLVLPPRIAGTLPPVTDRRRAGLGATVVVEGIGEAARTFRIVAGDTDVAAGTLGADSPLTRALLGAKAGTRVVWQRPAGDRTVRVVSVSYDSAP